MPKYSFQAPPMGFQLLSREGVEEVYAGALQVLEKVGVMVDNPRALRVFEAYGAMVEAGENRVRLQESHVRESVSEAPEAFTLHDRSGREAFKVGGDNVYFNPGSTALSFLDLDSGEARRPTSRDLADFTRLVDALGSIHAQSTALVVSDVPEPVVDSYRLYVVLKNSPKPVVTGAFTVEGVGDMARMLEAVVGDGYGERPMAIFDICPSPPLMWSSIASQNLIDCTLMGLPVELVSMPIAGGSGPVTLAGSLVQHTAESLSGLVLAQAVKPGSKVVYGGSPSILDMRYGTTAMGAVETVMMSCAYAEVGKYLGLPTHAYLGLSDAKVMDPQAGLESAIGITLAALKGVNIVSGPGMLEFESCQSLEKLIHDNEICGMAQRLKRGIQVSEESLALNLLIEEGPGGQFLSSKHTRDWFRREHFIPSQVIDRMDRKRWQAQGAKDSATNAKRIVRRILADHKPDPLAPEAERSLDEVAKDVLKRGGAQANPLFSPA